MKLTEFLEGLSTKIYHPELVDLLGGITPCLLLCQFSYWTGKQKDPEGWIYKTQEEIKRETGLSSNEQRTARKHLTDRGILKERFIGTPRRLEFSVDCNILKNLWLAFQLEGVKPTAKEDKRKHNKPSSFCIEARKNTKAESAHKLKKSIYGDIDNQSIEIENININKSEKSIYCDRKNQSQEIEIINGLELEKSIAIDRENRSQSIYTKITHQNTAEITYTKAEPPAPVPHLPRPGMGEEIKNQNLKAGEQAEKTQASEEKSKPNSSDQPKEIEQPTDNSQTPKVLNPLRPAAFLSENENSDQPAQPETGMSMTKFPRFERAQIAPDVPLPPSPRQPKLGIHGYPLVELPNTKKIEMLPWYERDYTSGTGFRVNPGFAHFVWVENRDKDYFARMNPARAQRATPSWVVKAESLDDRFVECMALWEAYQEGLERQAKLDAGETVEIDSPSRTMKELSEVARIKMACAPVAAWWEAKEAEQKAHRSA